MNARSILWYITFAGFAINYMQRIHINIIIVGMLDQNNLSTNKGITSLSYCQSKLNQTIPLKIDFNSTDQVLKRNEFDWDEKVQNLVLGSFFWLHWLTQIPGGILARHYGTKLVFGLANFLSCVITFALPAAARYHVYLLILLRTLQGFITGVSWPSMHHLTAHWIPPNERSKFVSSYLGSSVGVAITFPLCGYIMSSFGWEFAFYITGIIGFVWYFCWCLLVFDTPDDHPWISQKERDYINGQINKSVTKRELPVPWKTVLTSFPVWLVAISQFGGIWGLYTLLTQSATYFKNVIGLNIKQTGVFSGLPHLTRWLFSFGSGIFGDYLIKTNTLSRTNVRKLATTFCTIIQGLMIIALAYSGCNAELALIFLVSATAVNGAVSTGPIACVVDISPNFAGVLLGIVNMFGNLPGIISPIIVGKLTYQNQTIEQWQKVYLISAVILIVCGLLYNIFGDANIQSWNDGDKSLKVETEDVEKKKIDFEMANLIVASENMVENTNDIKR